MMFGSQHYVEGSRQPQRGHGVDWHVWCSVGALQVLGMEEFKTKLPYVINFANGSCARIQPKHPLWEALVEISKDYSVTVFELTLDGGYVPWDGTVHSLRSFDAIMISKRG